MTVYELNIDGLVGPTHNYAGLATGNIASEFNAFTTANPKKAVKQGITKMRALHKLGIKQAVFPPHARPNLNPLKQVGFEGKPGRLLIQAYKHEPKLLAACFSASSMWAANSATVTSSLDSNNETVNFTAANLISNFHRHQEADFSHKLLQLYFSNSKYFTHHSVLPRVSQFGDEGAANHTRLSASHDKPGVSLFVYGRRGFIQEVPGPEPVNYPARQTKEASMAIARSHEIKKTVFAQQNPDMIDLGVFHNDVIGVGNESIYFYHEDSFLNKQKVLRELSKEADFDIQFIEVTNEEISAKEVISSYLFNSQLITLDNGDMAFIVPDECKESVTVSSYLANLANEKSNPINQIQYINLKQSMRNGGGPACLRLRVPLTEDELGAMKQSILVDDDKLDFLDRWAEKHYRDRLHVDDLLDPSIINESYQALDELTQILELGSIYHFQS